MWVLMRTARGLELAEVESVDVATDVVLFASEDRDTAISAIQQFADNSTGVRFQMTFQEGEKTVDRRMIDAGSINFNRQPPLPVMLMTENNGGHKGAMLAGVADEIGRDGNVVYMRGTFDAGSEAGQEAARLVNDKVLETWSPDVGDTSVEVEVLAEDADGWPTDWVEHLTSGTLIGGTIAPFPALSSAKVVLLSEQFAKQSQDSVNYRPADGAQRCGNCQFFDAANNTCSKVAGSINSGWVCDLWKAAQAAASAAPEVFAVSEKSWDGSSSRFTDDQWKRATAACEGKSDAVKTDCYLPHHEPDGAVSRNGVHAAAGRFNQTSRANKDRARSHLAGHYRSDLKEQVPDSLAASLLAAGGPLKPPASWFAVPSFVEPTPMTIADDERVFGHGALWGTCHIGREDICLTPPHSARGYADFMLKALETDEGQIINVGTITLGTGHAALSKTAAAATAHYDDTGCAVADVVCGEDEFGIWFAGALRPGLSEEQIRTLRGSAISGDWRRIGGGLELVAMLAVNVPGFPVTRAAVASGQEVALVAAGARPLIEPKPWLKAVRALEARIAELEAVVATQKLVTAPLRGDAAKALMARVNGES